MTAPAPHPDATTEIAGVVLQHAYRGMRLQLSLRGVLVVFVGLTLALAPPEHAVAWCAAIAIGYAAWAVGLTVWSLRGGERPVRLIWLALFIDLAVLAALTLTAGVTSGQSWTADILTNGFFLIPVLAATQLRWRLCAAVGAATVVVSLASSVATKEANEEPWSSIVLGTVALAAVGAGCVMLSRIQRSRVATIATLFSQRGRLLGELLNTEDRERRELAEHLHDGALQYVLAARHDLEDARDFGDPESFTRLERSLIETSGLLRSTVAQLHPAVIAQSGLARALLELVQSAQTRGGFAADADVEEWPDNLRTSVDALLFSAARELLANVVRHADARHVHAVLCADQDRQWARLVIADDGRGIDIAQLDARVAEGHIGLASHRLKVAAAGGDFALTDNVPHGTVATVDVPYGR